MTASASGLDPDISAEYAALQVPRVAEANGLTESAGARTWSPSTPTGRALGILGRAAVNVLDAQHRRAAGCGHGLTGNSMERTPVAAG